MGWREKANKSLDAEDPAQTLLNSMGVFVRAFFKGDGWSLVSRGGLRQLSFILEGKVEGLEMLAGGSGMGRWYLTTALLKRSTALLETFPGSVEASGSPVTAVAEIKTFLWIFFPSLPTWMQSSLFPCPAVLVLEGL